jgi:carboxypeptidase T
VDHHDINLVLMGNPDGRRLAEVSATQNKRKNHNPSFTCATSPLLGQGVDLNRNYPFDWGGSGSSPSVCSDLFRGTVRGSEPETQAIIAREQAVLPDQRNETPIPAIDLTTPVSIDATGVYIDVHTNGNGNWYSWGNVVATAPNSSQLRTLARKLGFYNGFPTDQSATTGAIGGATDDFTFATLGVTSFTMELNGSSFFPTCTTYESSIAPGTINSLQFAAKVVRAPLKLPSGPELSNVVQSIGAGGLTITANASDVRVNTSAQVAGQPAETPSNIVGVDIYDTPPWVAGATPIGSFVAQDGSFNATAEQVTFTIPINQLPAQKTLWYLQARDAGAAGFQAGPITAVFVSGDAIFQNGFE